MTIQWSNQSMTISLISNHFKCEGYIKKKEGGIEYVSENISVDLAHDLIGEMEDISPEMTKAFKNDTMTYLFDDILWENNISKKDLDEFIVSSFKVKSNPLPYIRNMVKNHNFKVKFYRGEPVRDYQSLFASKEMATICVSKNLIQPWFISTRYISKLFLTSLVEVRRSEDIIICDNIEKEERIKKRPLHGLFKSKKEYYDIREFLQEDEPIYSEVCFEDPKKDPNNPDEWCY